MACQAVGIVYGVEPVVLVFGVADALAMIGTTVSPIAPGTALPLSFPVAVMVTTREGTSPAKGISTTTGAGAAMPVAPPVATLNPVTIVAVADGADTAGLTGSALIDAPDTETSTSSRPVPPAIVRRSVPVWVELVLIVSVAAVSVTLVVGGIVVPSYTGLGMYKRRSTGWGWTSPIGCH